MKNQQNIAHFGSSKNILVFVMKNDVFPEQDSNMSSVLRSVTSLLPTKTLLNIFV